MNLEKLQEYLKSEEYQKYIDTRFELLKAAELSYEARVYLYREFQKNIYKWIEICGWVYEPRNIQEPDIIFVPFDYQADLIYRLEKTFYDGDVLYIEKSRDMGITWTIVHWLVYHWLFTEKFSALIGSRKEAEVDNRSSSSIFGKIRYLVYAQPKWLFPKNFKKKFHDNHMKLINPENGSVLYGESANPNYGRGHRTSAVIMDECAYWPYLEESLRSVQDTSRVKIYISTPTENQFLKRFVDNLREQNKVLTLHWKQHPFKDEEWYKKEFELRKEDPLSFLAELELSYDVDPKLRYYPEAYECQIEPIEFDPKLPLYASADFAGFQDYTALCWYQYDPLKNEIRNLTAIASHGRLMPNKLLIDWWLPFLNPEIPYDKMWYNEYERELLERVRSWGKPKIVFGEPAHRQVSQVAGYSFETILRKNGVNFLIVTIGTSHEIRKRAVQKYLKITKFNANDSGSLRLLDALKSAKISERALRGTTEGKIVPLHISPEADLRSAHEMFCLGFDVFFKGNTLGSPKITTYARRY
jgi:hypothetical protein